MKKGSFSPVLLRFLFVFSLLAFATEGSILKAHAVEISLLGGMNFSAPTYSLLSVPQPTSSTGGLVFGTLCAIPLIYSFEIETGLLYQSSEFAYANSSTSTSAQFNEYQIPLVLRFKVDEKVGLGFGTYWTTGTGGVELRSGSARTLNTFADLNLYPNDIGLIFNVHALLPLTHFLALVVDGRFLLGLKERSKDLTLSSYKTRSIQGLLGFAVLF